MKILDLVLVVTCRIPVRLAVQQYLVKSSSEGAWGGLGCWAAAPHTVQFRMGLALDRFLCDLAREVHIDSFCVWPQ